MAGFLEGEMMDAKHTPGPWAISHGGMPGDCGFSVVTNNAAAKNVRLVAECWALTITSEEHRQELFANGRLIAAAPELLDAVSWFIDQLQGDSGTGHSYWKKFPQYRAALAAYTKAKGE